MMLQAFAVYDEKAEAYMAPFFYPGAGLAIRAFQDATKDPDSPISKHPGDYKLYRVGYFDDNDGSFEAEANPVLMADGSAELELRVAK